MLKRPRLTRQTFGDIRNRYSNRHVQIGKGKSGDPIFMPLGKWWLDHPLRRQHDRVVFSPEREVPGAYNLWRGFACEARPGDCELFLTHIRDNVCGGRADLYEYVVGWLATLVQHPARPGHVALVLRGQRGTGKSFFATQVGRLLGRHFLHVSDPSHLVGNFNSHLRDTLLLFADEAFGAGDKRHESKLKALITEQTLAIEAKGVDVEQAPNYIHLIMASNDQWVVPAGHDERRYAVLDLPETRKQDHAYFGAIAAEMESGGSEALLHHLLNLDLDGFNVRQAPSTDGLTDQKVHSLRGLERFWHSCLMTGEVPVFEPDRLRYSLLIEVAMRRDKSLVRCSESDVGQLLNNTLGLHTRPKRDRVNRSVHQPPPLAECRAAWDRHKFPVGWPDTPADWVWQQIYDDGDPHA